MFTISLLIFVDMCTHVHYALYSQIYFTVNYLQKTMKIEPLENFPLYSMSSIVIKLLQIGLVSSVSHIRFKQEIGFIYSVCNSIRYE